MPIKAFLISDRNGDGYSQIVYGETRGKALAYAVHQEEFEDYTYTELRANRIKSLDSYYYGKRMLDWSNMDDRGMMVKCVDMYCSYEYDPSPEECAECTGKHDCSRYERDHETY